jgi:histidine triad (HIT) family protein
MVADCIFCKIADGTIPSEKVYENEDVLAFRDIHPAAPTHIIVIPKKHYATLNDIPQGEMSILSKIYSAIQEVAKKTNVADQGFRTVVNTNRSAGQVVFHLHFHILGGRPLGTMG